MVSGFELFTSGVLISMAVVFQSGCDRKESAQPSQPPAQAAAPTPAPKTPTLTDDPAASFETYSQKFVRRAQELAAAQDGQDRKLVWPASSNVSINVQKTDSLMSPFVGTISSKLSVVEKVKEEGARKVLKDLLIDGCMWTEVDCTLAFAAQKGKWVLTSVRATDPRHPSADAAPFVSPTMEQAAASVPQ